jgi:hypothetical protein
MYSPEWFRRHKVGIARPFGYTPPKTK